MFITRSTRIYVDFMRSVQYFVCKPVMISIIVTCTFFLRKIYSKLHPAGQLPRYCRLPAPGETQPWISINIRNIQKCPQHWSPIFLLQYIVIDTEYIQNSDEQNEQLQKLFDELRVGKHSYIYVLMGIVDHYVVVKVSK